MGLEQQLPFSEYTLYTHENTSLQNYRKMEGTWKEKYLSNPVDSFLR